MKPFTVFAARWRTIGEILVAIILKYKLQAFIINLYLHKLSIIVLYITTLTFTNFPSIVYEKDYRLFGLLDEKKKVELSLSLCLMSRKR
jgi:hypothetical protein